MNYKEYLALQERRGNSNRGNSGSSDRPTVHFASEFLAKDGSSVVVRFPYHSMEDIVYTPTHRVEWPGSIYGKRVKCNENQSCPLCNEGMPLDIRVMVKFLAYTINSNNEVVINNTLWDRPAAFADMDMKSLFDEYGDITKLLFKIRRSGSGRDTRYNIQPIINKDVYPDEVYVANFAELNQIDPDFILTKSYQQYQEMLHPELAAARKAQKAKEESATAPQSYTNSAPVSQTVYVPQAAAATENTYLAAQAPVNSSAGYNPPEAPQVTVETPTQTPPVNTLPTPPRRQITYKF